MVLANKLVSRQASEFNHLYDLMIVGAGISGSEAALACAASGLDVLLVTTSLDTAYTLLGEGAYLTPKAGTFMAEVFSDLAKETGFVGNWAMHRAAKQKIETMPNLHFLQSSVSALRLEEDRVVGVETWEGVPRFAKRIALCVGSFLEARLHIGTLSEVAGRLSEMAYDDLYLNLETLGFVFEDLSLEAKFTDDSLPYTVDCKVFAPSELEQFRLKRFKHLYAAGVCASAYLSFEAAAEQGQDLASVLIKSLS